MMRMAGDRSDRYSGREIVLGFGASAIVSAWFFIGPWGAVLLMALLTRMVVPACADETALKRFIAALFLLAGVLAVVSVIVASISVPYHPWSAIRSAWPSGILRGYPLYYDQGGPLIGRMYGPVFPLFYLLAGSMHDLRSIVHGGSLISMCFFFAPAWLIFMRSAQGRSPALAWSAGYMVVFILFTLASPSLKQAAFAVHVDAPALGFGALACWMLIRVDRPSMADLFISAACVVLAFWSKQTTAPLVMVLPVYVWIFHGGKVVRAYLLNLVLAGLLSVLVIASLVGMNAMLYEMFYIPFHQPSQFASGWFEGMVKALPFLVEEALWMQVILAAGLFGMADVLRRNGQNDLIAAWMRNRVWVLFVFMAVAMAPLALLSRAKVCGDLNTLSSVAFYGALALAMVVVDLYHAVLSQASRGSRHMLIMIAFVLVGLLNITVWRLNEDLGRLAHIPPYKVSDQAARFIRQYPAEAYFPAQNLEHLLVEGRMYHNIDGLSDRFLAGVRVERDHLQAFIPARMKFIALETRYIGLFRRVMRAYFPDFSQKIFFKDLPDFTVFVRRETYDTYRQGRPYVKTARGIEYQ